VHGTVHEVKCLSCHDRTSMRSALDRWTPANLIRPACAAAADCDVLRAVGTSLRVWPVAGLVEIAAAHGARVGIVNAEPTPYDELADLVVREPIGTALPPLLAAAS
jgi:NAD-dependent deacetylase